MPQLEAQELKEETGIRTLKIGYNRVFGYYIEVSQFLYRTRCLQDFVRKQTLANAERYITEDLKALENKILGAERAPGWSWNASCLTICCTRLSAAAAAYPAHGGRRGPAGRPGRAGAGGCERTTISKPVVDEGDELIIEEGRHPVVEQMLASALFVPNDTVLD